MPRKEKKRAGSAGPGQVLFRLGLAGLISVFASLGLLIPVVRDAEESRQSVSRSSRLAAGVALALEESYQRSGRYADSAVAAALDPSSLVLSAADPEVRLTSKIASNRQSFYLSAQVVAEQSRRQAYLFQIVAGRGLPTFTSCSRAVSFYGDVCLDGQWDPGSVPDPIKPGPARASSSDRFDSEPVRPAEFTASVAEIAGAAVEKFYRKRLRRFSEFERSDIYRVAPELEIAARISRVRIRLSPNRRRAVVDVRWANPSQLSLASAYKITINRFGQRRYSCADSTIDSFCANSRWRPGSAR